MYYPSLEEFLKLSKKNNLIPVYKEIKVDLDTPVSAFLKLKKDNYAFLLESVEGQERIARFSFLGSCPEFIFRSKGKHIELTYPIKKQIKKFTTNLTPLDEIKKVMHGFKAARLKGLPRFYGGLVGYMGYDMVRFFENIPDKNKDDLKIADAVFILTTNILIFDHLNHTLKIVNNVIMPDKYQTLSRRKRIDIYNKATRKIEAIYSDFIKPYNLKKEKDASSKKINVESNFTKKDFSLAVKKAKNYIKNGDIIQVVLSQRFKINVDLNPFKVYRNLRSINPSPYMYFLKLKDFYIVGSSPEMLVRCEDGLIQTRPIAGTRPRGCNEKKDLRFAEELLVDKKEKAEHIMLVDLGRNDLGRVSKKGSVVVSEFMDIEKYSHVMHLVSEVKGQLDNAKYDIYDVLKAAFPAGTVSGSPKIRAMEIIDELENIKRGPYAGCVGYFSFTHNMDTCITIRTVIIKGNYAYIQAGAGIVADSVPQREYLETVNKAKALIEAIKG